jgi:hypothetical protein
VPGWISSASCIAGRAHRVPRGWCAVIHCARWRFPTPAPSPAHVTASPRSDLGTYVSVKQRHLIATAVEPQASIEGVRRTPLVRDDAQDKKMSTRVLVWLFRGRVSLPLAQCSRDINLVEVFWHLRSWTVGRGENCIVRYLIGALALGLATGSAEPVAAQQILARGAGKA